MCVCVWIMVHVHMCLFLCILYTRIVRMRVCVYVYCVWYICVNAQMYDINTYTHIRICIVMHMYTHPYRQDYMSGHSCVCLYESWYMYTCVSFYPCYIRILCLCVSVSMCTCVIWIYIHKYTFTQICDRYIHTCTHRYRQTTWAATHVCVCMDFGECTHVSLCMYLVHVYCKYACLF